MQVDDVAGRSFLALMHGDNALEGALQLALPLLTARRLAAMPTRRGGCGAAWAGATVSALVALGADADEAATTTATHALLRDVANAPIPNASAAAANAAAAAAAAAFTAPGVAAASAAAAAAIPAAAALATATAASADVGNDLFRLGDACALYLAGIAGLVGWMPVLAAAAKAAPRGTLAARVLCCGLPAAAVSLESHLVSCEGSESSERTELLPAAERLVWFAMGQGVSGGRGEEGEAGPAGEEDYAAVTAVAAAVAADVSLAAAARLLRKLRRRRPDWVGGAGEAALFERAVAPHAPAPDAHKTTTPELARRHRTIMRALGGGGNESNLSTDAESTTRVRASV